MIGFKLLIGFTGAAANVANAAGLRLQRSSATTGAASIASDRSYRPQQALHLLLTQVIGHIRIMDNATTGAASIAAGGVWKATYIRPRPKKSAASIPAADHGAGYPGPPPPPVNEPPPPGPGRRWCVKQCGRLAAINKRSGEHYETCCRTCLNGNDGGAGTGHGPTCDEEHGAPHPTRRQQREWRKRNREGQHQTPDQTVSADQPPPPPPPGTAAASVAIAGGVWKATYPRPEAKTCAADPRRPTQRDYQNMREGSNATTGTASAYAPVPRPPPFSIGPGRPFSIWPARK